MKRNVWLTVEVYEGDDRYCNEDCPFMVETATNDKCIAFGCRLQLNTENYRYYRNDTCKHNQIGK
jgi:hypothetical protein